MSDPKDQNEGEGSRTAARAYNSDLRAFIAEDRVEPAAKDAKQYVDAHPTEAAEAEATAKAGPTPIAKRVEELYTEGRAMVDRAVSRVRSVIERRRRRR
jgi:hypothetical protein